MSSLSYLICQHVAVSVVTVSKDAAVTNAAAAAEEQCDKGSHEGFVVKYMQKPQDTIKLSLYSI